MKAVIACLLFLAFVLFMNVKLMAQNGGQAHSNNFVSISNYGYINGGYSLNITNKQSCPVSYRLSIKGKHVEIGPVAANTAFSYHLVTQDQDCSVRIQCKPLNSCIPGPDMGQVEAKCMEGPDLSALPVKFIYFKMEKVK